LAILFAALLMLSTSAGEINYVDTNATGANNGLSRANYYDYLHDFPVAVGPQVQWQKTFGGSSYDEGYSVQQTADGGYIIAGYTSSFGAGYRDVYLIKTDPNGNSQWQKIFGGSASDEAYSVQQTADGGYIIVGETRSFGAGGLDVYLIKTDPNGNSQWQRTFGGGNTDVGYSVQQTADGGYIIAGDTSSFGAGLFFFDVYLIKADQNGNLQWQKTLGGSNFDCGWSIEQTADGGYIIAGGTESFGDPVGDVYLVKTDPNGNMQWQKALGGNSFDRGRSVQQTADGGYIIAGVTESFGAGRRDVYLIKTDPNGNSQWEKTFGGSDWDWAYSVQQTSDGGYIITGETYSFGAGQNDVYLIKTDPNGDSQWEKAFGGISFETGRSVQQTVDGGYIIAGETYSFGGGRTDVYLIKLGPPNTEPVACIVGGDRIVECEGCWGAKITLDGSCSSDADSTPGTNDDIASFDWYKVDASDPNFVDFLGSGEIIDCNIGVGEHIIVLEVIDKAGTFDTNEVSIIIQDTAPPEFALSVNPATLWPPNKKMVKITPTWTVSDKCDATPAVSLVSISINEGGTNGRTEDDVKIGDDGSIYLRAKRNRGGNERIYTLTYRAVDDSENATVRSATVKVPHKRR